MKKKLLCIAFCLLLVALFSGCDGDLEVIRYEFGQFPRVVYIAGVDKELDFLDSTLISTARNGFQHEFSLAPAVAHGSFVRVKHSIDFNTPGVYKVELHMVGSRNLEVVFLVQVISEEIFNELKSGTR